MKLEVPRWVRELQQTGDYLRSHVFSGHSLRKKSYFRCLWGFGSSTSRSPVLAPDISLSVNGHSYGYAIVHVSCYSPHVASVPLTPAMSCSAFIHLFVQTRGASVLTLLNSYC